MLSTLRKILCKFSTQVGAEQITPLEQKKLHLSLSEFQNRRNYTFRTEKTTPLVRNTPLIMRKYSKHAIYFLQYFDYISSSSSTVKFTADSNF